VSRLRIAEVFGVKAENLSASAREIRDRKWCPFRDCPCTKDNASDPLGVCSLIEDETLVVTCPFRFLQGGKLFQDASSFAFGPYADVVVIPEVPFLRSTTSQSKLGKIDYVLVKHTGGMLVNFCALEVQSVYMSGASMRDEFRHYLDSGEVTLPVRERHADYRSSSHKRLMPQLMIKVPALRRWGKRMLVAVHEDFFDWLPACTETDPSNAELTWMVYSARDRGDSYGLELTRTASTTLDDAILSLTAAVPPPRDEFEAQLQDALSAQLSNEPAEDA
jgi:hypothetical protein